MDSYSEVVSPGNFRDGSSISLRSVTSHCFSVRLSNIAAIFEDSNKDRSLNKSQKILGLQSYFTLKPQRSDKNFEEVLSHETSESF